MIQSMVLQFTAKRQLSLAAEEITKLCTLVICVATVCIKSTVNIILNQDVNSVMICKPCARLRATISSLSLDVKILNYFAAFQKKSTAVAGMAIEDLNNFVREFVINN